MNNDSITYEKINHLICNQKHINYITKLFNQNYTNHEFKKLIFNNIIFNNNNFILNQSYFKPINKDETKELIDNIFIKNKNGNLFKTLLNKFIKLNITNLQYLNIKHTIIYKSIKYFAANIFSSSVEKHIFNLIYNNELSNNIKNLDIKDYIYETENDIQDINILFFICISYSILDTIIDNEIKHIKFKKEYAKQILTLFNQYLNNNDYNHDNIPNNDFKPIMILLLSLLKFCEIKKYNITTINIIKANLNIEFECFKFENTTQPNTKYIELCIKKGIGALLLSFLSKPDYLNSYINLNSNDDDINLLELFGIMGQLVDDICDFKNDRLHNKFVITSFQQNNNNLNNNQAQPYFGYNITLCVYLTIINNITNIIKHKYNINNIEEILNNKNINIYLQLFIFGLWNNKEFINHDIKKYLFVNNNKYYNDIENNITIIKTYIKSYIKNI